MFKLWMLMPLNLIRTALLVGNLIFNSEKSCSKVSESRRVTINFSAHLDGTEIMHFSP